jgi:bacillithiol system protein YtxJ
VDHQSPQAILIKDGMAIYDASHFSIDFDEIRNRIDSAAVAG